ncbi:rod shape-determining protein MreC [Methyloversatilis sp.]|uniref:rod shape-determining protein MreC n=1 Tax=Methyloversatilis sp. TaxID=2569862 RepID=UPI0027369D7B|nr:rod shape-determining protein MreC [Methyloversatilis sp.]MDP2868223.1 rod shape-determining protein MreC [Methyloversatilis sp.]MDP3286976.1 rod shape-determining protein MreC [Methyloversatilis sp.]MDP3456168.1 rod shape-determining protein MreC [Methyloversatilis sp.]MDP3577421.1 rod shape-determining protein MreC [Methyloversatilis sp.]
MVSPVAGHSPPPFFRRGPAPLVRLVVLVSAALTLIVVDHRLNYLELLRQGLSVVTTPLQVAAGMPVKGVRSAGEYFADLARLQAENDELRREQVALGTIRLRQEQLDLENTRLRALLDMRERVQVNAQVAEVIYAVRDPFSRRVVVDKGLTQGIEPGSPVVDDIGVIGQVTRVYPLNAEVTLISDKDQALPVQIARTGVRAVMFGAGSGTLELRYLATDVDLREGDRIVTSGLDGVFAPGLPVARVKSVDRDGSGGFVRILCVPLAGVESHSTVLIMAPGKPVLPADDVAATAGSARAEKAIKP